MRVVGKGFMTTDIAFGCPDSIQEIVFCGLIFFLIEHSQSDTASFSSSPIVYCPSTELKASFAVISKMMCGLKQERGLPAGEQQWQVSWEQRVASVQAGAVLSPAVHQ